MERIKKVWAYIHAENREKLKLRSKVRLVWGTSVVLVVGFELQQFVCISVSTLTFLLGQHRHGNILLV